MADERTEWTGTPSQMQNLGWFIACLLLIPIPWAIWRWMVTRNTVYTLTDQRLSIRRGVFNRVTEDLELYRVREFAVANPPADAPSKRWVLQEVLESGPAL